MEYYVKFFHTDADRDFIQRSCDVFDPPEPPSKPLLVRFFPQSALFPRLPPGYPMLYSSFESLDELVAALPFHLDDISAINATYLRWYASRDAHEREVIQLWTYCFIRRYFLVKFVQEASWSAVDLDMIVETAFRKTEEREGQIREPSRYANWVSVVCKNTFRNYLRSKRHQIPIGHVPLPSLVAETPVAYNEPGQRQEALARAIDRLPPHLHACVRLRFLTGLSYTEIAQRTGRPLPTIRAYIYKAIKRLREDAEFLKNFE